MYELRDDEFNEHTEFFLSISLDWLCSARQRYTGQYKKDGHS